MTLCHTVTAAGAGSINEEHEYCGVIIVKRFSYAIAAFHSAEKRIFAVEKGPSLLFWSLPKKEEFFRHQKRKCLKLHRKT